MLEPPTSPHQVQRRQLSATALALRSQDKPTAGGGPSTVCSQSRDSARGGPRRSQAEATQPASGRARPLPVGQTPQPPIPAGKQQQPQAGVSGAEREGSQEARSSAPHSLLCGPITHGTNPHSLTPQPSLPGCAQGSLKLAPQLTPSSIQRTLQTQVQTPKVLGHRAGGAEAQAITGVSPAPQLSRAACAVSPPPTPARLSDHPAEVSPLARDDGVSSPDQRRSSHLRAESTVPAPWGGGGQGQGRPG